MSLYSLTATYMKLRTRRPVFSIRGCGETKKFDALALFKNRLLFRKREHVLAACVISFIHTAFEHYKK